MNALLGLLVSFLLSPDAIIGAPVPVKQDTVGTNRAYLRDATYIPSLFAKCPQSANSATCVGQMVQRAREDRSMATDTPVTLDPKVISSRVTTAVASAIDALETMETGNSAEAAVIVIISTVVYAVVKAISDIVDESLHSDIGETIISPFDSVETLLERIPNMIAMINTMHNAENMVNAVIYAVANAVVDADAKDPDDVLNAVVNSEEKLVNAVVNALVDGDAVDKPSAALAVLRLRQSLQVDDGSTGVAASNAPSAEHVST